MSLTPIRKALTSFFEGPFGRAIAIKGRWGVGKTYLWKTMVADAVGHGRLPNVGYSYVSLFGVENLSELKLSIFEKSRRLESGMTADGDGGAIEFLKELEGKIDPKGLGSKLASAFLRSGFANRFVGENLSSAILFSRVKNQLICFDDLERRNPKFDIELVLGLASFLKEERNCKIAFLLNETELGNADQIKLSQYIEKIFDTSLVYDLQPKEAIDILQTSNEPILPRTAELCLNLQISNIRVINQIDGVVRQIKLLTSNYVDQVYQQISHSVALFEWCIRMPGSAPTIDLLKRINTAGITKLAGGAEDEENKKWGALLESYGYRNTDDDDLILIDQCRSGFFDPIKIDQIAKSIDALVKANEADSDFHKAWDLYHDSFNDNSAEVVDALYSSFKRNFGFISQMNLDGTVKVLRKLGASKKANELIQLYISGRNEPPEFFDIEKYPFGDSISDRRVKEAFSKKLNELNAHTKSDLKALLLAAGDNYDDAIVSELAGIMPNEYTMLFMSSSGKELKKLISNGLSFSRIANATENMKRVVENTRSALGKIGKSSKINAMRVSRFGIGLDKVEEAK